MMQGQRNIDLLLLLLLLDLNFFGVHVHSQVIGLDCNGVNSIFRDNGTDALISCNVTSSTIAWILPSENTIAFTPFTANPGDEVTSGVFKATYLQETPPGMSTIEFVLTPSLNGTNVTCADANSNIGSKSCYILVISTPLQPLDLSVMSTFQSVLLRWSPPSFNGGSEITCYIISITPSPSDDSTCPGGQCNTTSLSFNVTGLTPNAEYQFNISAVNSAGEGDAATISATTIGVVFPALTDAPQLCLNYTDTDGLQLVASWNCSSAISNATTPPLTNYTVCINNDCSMVSSCSLSVPVNCSDTYDVNVSLNNIIGSSGPSPIANINTDILQPSMVDMITNESVRINYTTFIACNNTLSSGTINITLNNMNTSSMETRTLTYNTNGAVTIGSLYASTIYSYSLSLTVNDNDVCNVTQMGNFITSDTGDDDGGTTPSPTPNVTVATTTSDPTEASTGGFPVGAIIGIIIGCLLFFICVILAMLLIIYAISKRKTEKSKDTATVLYDTPTNTVQSPASVSVGMKENVAYGSAAGTGSIHKAVHTSDNIAYGHVHTTNNGGSSTVHTSGNIAYGQVNISTRQTAATTAAVYETVH